MKSYGWENFGYTNCGIEFTDLPMSPIDHSYTETTLPTEMADSYNYTNIENCSSNNDRYTEAIFNHPKCKHNTEVPCMGTVSCLEEYIHNAPSGRMLRNLQNKKVNLILLATSLGKNEIIKNLENNLDCERSCIVPLTSWPGGNNSTNEESDSSDQISICSDNSNCANDPNDPNDPNDSTGESNGKKRKWSGKKDENYWKRRKCNNEAARRSREAKKDRFVWMENRTKELSNENNELEKQLDGLKDRLSFLMELKNKKNKMCY